MISGELRITPGEGEPWMVAVADRWLVALPTSAAEEIRALVAEDPRPVTIEEVMARLPAARGGRDELAVLWWSVPQGPLTVVSRGAAAVELETASGPRSLRADDIRPWLLAEFQGVRRVRLGPLPLSPLPLGTRHPAPPPRLGPPPGRLRLLDTGAAGAPPKGVAARGWPRRPADAVVEELPAGVLEWCSTDSADAADAAAPALHPRSAVTTEPVPTAPGDVRTFGAFDAPEPRGPARFRVAGGAVRDVESIVLIGRRPRLPRVPDPPVVLVQVDDAASTVSATHLELRREGERLVATDLRSTNGTVVHRASGTRRMRSGESIVVDPGTLLQLGGDTIVEILAPSQDQEYPDRQVPA